MRKDHNYSFSPHIDVVREKCSKLQDILEQKAVAEKALRKRLSRAIQKGKKLGDVIDQLHDQKMISTGAADYMERFDGE